MPTWIFNMFRYIRNCLTCALFALLWNLNAAAIDIPPIIRLGIEKGLSNNSVRSIFQDHNGYIWFGTYDGLNRYDGYDFKVFRNIINDSNSLPHNYIYALNEDALYNLWVGTGQGVAVYNNITGKFRPAYYTPFGEKSIQRITFNVTTIAKDKAGNIFLGSNGAGFSVIKMGEKVAVQVPVFMDGRQRVDYNVTAICTDKEAQVWALVNGLGLCRFDLKNGKLDLVNNIIPTASSMGCDGHGNLWIGTNAGLYKYNIAGNTITSRFNEENGKLTANNLTCLCLGKDGMLWAGTEGGGINVLNPLSEQVENILPGEGKYSITSESVYAIYEDAESRKWIGTIKGGINIVDPGQKRFQTISHDPLNANSLVSNFVGAFFEDKTGNLWIGTDGGGISIWNRSSNTYRNYKHSPGNPLSLSNDHVTSIRQDRSGNFWVATFGGGINKFKAASGTFMHYKCINAANGQENRNVWLLLEDREQTLWATTFSDGHLYRFNKQADRFEVFNEPLNDLVSITEDSEGNIWAGNHDQLIRIDKRAANHSIFTIGKPVRAIFEDSKGSFWLGTEGGGLLLFDRKQGKIMKRYTTAEGLCNNAVLNILEDNTGNLWLSTFNGLSRFSTAAQNFQNYYQSDGLQSNQFLYSASLRLRSGELAFGGIYGFNLFEPGKITGRSFMPPVMITGIKVNNQPLNNEPDLIYKTSGDLVKTIRLPFSKATLSIDFAALEFSSPGKIVYAYMLEGLDKSWNFPGSVRIVNYNNIREGKYVLHVKSTNAEGVWNTSETQLQVIVLPPWYRSWWAYLVYFLSIVGIIYVYLKYKDRQTQLEYEVKLSKLNIEKEKEINERKLSFFTNVSHEFRTPLTLIINPLKDLLHQHAGEDSTERKELNIIYRNSRRLLSMVDQLLLFRKAEQEETSFKLTRLNFYNLCREVYLCFVQQARAKKIEYLFECNNDKLEIFGDREKLEIIFYNLISNALKYTPDGGRILFRISEDNEHITAAVTDTGYGIPEETGNRLFEKYHQVKKRGIPSKPGFGIGLFLVKEFVGSHKGSITYTSQLGNGTTFWVKLQKGVAHFGDLEDVESDVPDSNLLSELVENVDEEFESAAAPVEREVGELVTEQPVMLVVDDNEEMRDYVSNLFAEKYNVLIAGNGEQGLKMAREYQPDIIISDIYMPGMTGLELCSQVKGDPALSHIPVILLTGSPSSETKLQGAEGGADDYITKPFEKELLIARVAGLLKSRTILQKYFYDEITLQKSNLKISAEYKEFLDACIAIVEKHLDDEDFSIQTLASEIGMSHSKLYKKVKSISGQSASAFIRFIRLRKAAEMFINTTYNVNETAFYVGIKDVKYFRKQFHKTFGMNPSEYIEKYRKTLGKSYHLSDKMLKSKA